MKQPADHEILEMFRSIPPPPADNTYELALVLGGSVSSGAYTAGAMDFLIEALDTWTRLRDAGDPSAPTHKLALRTITGTSGGGLNAIIAARALAFEYPHINPATRNPGDENPFYDVWINRLDLGAMLDTSDLRSGDVTSLLNGRVIDEVAVYIENFSGSQMPALRSYISDPLSVILTLTNLRGMAYTTYTGHAAGMRQNFVTHADFARFNIVYPGQRFDSPRGDEWMLGFGNVSSTAGWSDFSLFARASGAFPIGLPPRQLHRPLEHYRYRVAVLPGDGTAPGDISLLIPNLEEMVGHPDGEADYVFYGVDGGMINNQPVQLARTTLSGVLGRNPRNGQNANRGVLLIDPVAGNAGLGSSGLTGGAFDVGMGLLNALMQQTRHSPGDILLAQHPDVYSRFMISAERNGIFGEKALATSGLCAFIGYASASLRRHDYFLGRANAQACLKNTFVLPEDNIPVFRGCWTQEQVRQHRVAGPDGKTCLPVIPLLGTAAVAESTEPFPIGALSPEIFRDAIKARFSAMVETEGAGGIVSESLSWLLAHAGEGRAANRLIGQMQQALDDWGLA